MTATCRMLAVESEIGNQEMIRRAAVEMVIPFC